MEQLMNKSRKEAELQSLLKVIQSLDERWKSLAEEKWSHVAKPLHSLGILEEHVSQMAAVLKNLEVPVSKKALIVMCADNGVVAEGVTQTGQEVTAIVAENFLDVKTSAALMCKKAGVDLYPIDLGMAVDTRVPSYKVAYGTKNFAKEPAMTREEVCHAILTGIRLVKELKEQGYTLFATGEMGIGNTTTSSAVAAAILKEDVEVMTGRGAGLSSEGLRKKIQVIREALDRYQPDSSDAIQVLSCVGGFDIAGMAGVFLGGAIYQVPVLMDGFISAVAALCAVTLAANARDYILPTHVSKEPGMHKILDALQMEAPIHAHMCLGEGTGAVAYIPVLEMGIEVYTKMSTFDEIKVEEYQELK